MSATTTNPHNQAMDLVETAILEEIYMRMRRKLKDNAVAETADD